MKNPPDRCPEHLYPAFAKKIESILSAMTAWCQAHCPNLSPIFGEGYRSRARQAELYAQGRSVPGPIVTQRDGILSPSRHQSALAFDLWFMKKERVVFEGIPASAWDYYGHLCRQAGLDWGGDWPAFKDLPHAEWPTKDKQTYAAAKKWLAAHERKRWFVPRQG